MRTTTKSTPESVHTHRVATLLFDLLTESEAMIDESTGHLRFGIAFLAKRLVGATDWIKTRALAAHLPVGYFGGSTGAAAALVAAAAAPPGAVGAIVSRGGRPDRSRKSPDSRRTGSSNISQWLLRHS